jgi:N-acetylmuramoyl-L-alanine amidase
MSNFHYILDNGHGGFINGVYQTPPEIGKLFDHGNGFVLYEGLFNRQVVEIMAKMLKDEKIEYSILVPEQNDISLNDRVKRTNAINRKQNGRGIFISIHGNAGKGTGFEVFTTKGETFSDIFAEILINEIEKTFPAEKMRVDLSDGDKDKEANFFVLKCDCPAILSENLFFDNLKDAIIMNSPQGQNLIARAHVNAIKELERKYTFEDSKKEFKEQSKKIKK